MYSASQNAARVFPFFTDGFLSRAEFNLGFSEHPSKCLSFVDKVAKAVEKNAVVFVRSCTIAANK